MVKTRNAYRAHIAKGLVYHAVGKKTPEGRIEAGGKRGRWLLGTYKTLGTALSGIQIFGKFGGTLTYFATQYLREHRERFLSDQELRVRAIKGWRGGE